MDRMIAPVTPHPDYIPFLFAYKHTARDVFNAVLGLNNINHIALSFINIHQELLTLSSTPALEYNLFSSHLWLFDRTYHASWQQLEIKSSWQSLYEPAHYEELYYHKQVKLGYPTGYSWTTSLLDASIICSIASRKECPEITSFFANEYELFHDVALYCTKQLLPIFQEQA